MAEHRIAPRKPTRETGKAIINGRAEVECTIRDISSTGARISFRQPTFLPRTFQLRLASEGDQKVTVMWQGGVLAGVRFQNPLRTRAPAKRRSLFSWGR
jgi:hypothetical protein